MVHIHCNTFEQKNRNYCMDGKGSVYVGPTKMIDAWETEVCQ